METAELRRKLLWRAETDLSGILEGSPLNQQIYKLLIEVRPRYQVTTRLTTIFNELYYQCVRIERDDRPGQDLFERYLAEENAWTGSSLSSKLIFSLVCAVLRARKDISFKAGLFLSEIPGYISDSPFGRETNDLRLWISRHLPDLRLDLSPRPAPVQELPVYYEDGCRFRCLTTYRPIAEKAIFAPSNPWRTVTDGYRRSKIIDIIKLYDSRLDQQYVLERIAESCSLREHIEFGKVFAGISQQIDREEFLPGKSAAVLPEPQSSAPSDGLSKAYGPMEPLRTDSAKASGRESASGDSLTIEELANYASTRCTREIADAICAMLYRLTIKNGIASQRNTALIDAIIPAIDERENHLHQPADVRETQPIREQILAYVSCLSGLVSDHWKSRYMKLWEGILDLDIVAGEVYSPGKQQGTNFNRNMVANIIHYLGNPQKAENRVYADYNAARYAEKLDGDKDHSVRAALGKAPSDDIVRRLDRYLETFQL